jgi:hypothetical protein
MKSLSNALKRKNKETRPASIVSINDVAGSYNVSKPFTIGTLIKLLEPDVLTQHNSNDRTGVYMQLGLNQFSFSGNKRWGLIKEIPVDGAVYAQILYTEGLQVGNDPTNIQNVIFIATARNKIYAYAFDFPFNIFNLLWQRQLAPPDDSDMRPPFEGKPCSIMSPIDLDTNPVLLGIGIQATPVIDRSKNVMYVCFRTNDGSFLGSQAHQHLAMINISTGDLLNIVEITSPHLGITMQRNRASLLLVNDILYIALASHCEELDPEDAFSYNGWVFAYEAETLKQVGIYTTTEIANQNGGGIWQASNGLLGNNESIYIISGNGRFTPDGSNLSNSFVRIDPVIHRDANGSISKVDLKVKDWFTPYRQNWSNDIDLDLGSAGPILIPGTNLLVGGGKQGIIYVIDRNNMGQIDKPNQQIWETNNLSTVKAGDETQFPENFAADRVIQKFQAGINEYFVSMGKHLPMGDWAPWPHIHGSPIYHEFNNSRSMMYIWPEKDFLKAFERFGDRFNPAEHCIIVAPDGMPGGFLSLSVDPSMSGSGVIFACIPEVNAPFQKGILRAFDPMNLNELWNNARGRQYRFAKFCPPTIADGKVFLPTFSNKVLVYGPL